MAHRHECKRSRRTAEACSASLSVLEQSMGTKVTAEEAEEATGAEEEEEEEEATG